MVTLSRDTAPDVERMQIEHLRRLPTWRKLAPPEEMLRQARKERDERLSRLR